MIYIYKLNTASFSIGRSVVNDIFIEGNELLSSRHIEINVKRNSDELTMFGKNGGYISDRFIEKDEKVSLKYSSEIKLPGLTILWLHDYLFLGASNECIAKVRNNSPIEELTEIPYYEKLSEDLMNNFTPSPRTSLILENDSVELDSPPEKRDDIQQGMLLTIGPAFSMAIPMLLGFLISYLASKSSGGTSKTYMLTGLITAVASSVMGTIWASLNLKNRSQEILLNEEKRRKSYERYVQKSETLIREKYYKNRNTIRANNPPLEEIFLKRNWNAYIYNGQLLESNELKVRLGTGNLDFNIDIKIPKEKYSIVSDDLKKLPEQLKRKYSYFKDVPICINLLEMSPIGLICIEKIKLRESLNSLLLVAASAMSPSNLKIAIFLSKAKSYLYSYDLLVLPHLHTNEGCLIAIDKQDFNNIYKNIDKDINKLLVITDCYDEVKSCIDKIFNKEEGYGKNKRDLYVDNKNKSEKICYLVISDSFYKLPDNVKAIIQRDNHFDGLIDLSGQNIKRKEIYFDHIPEDDFKGYLRLLSMLSYGLNDLQKEIPDKVGFLELNKVFDLEKIDVISIWKENSTINEIKIPIGLSEYKETVYLDFHEKGNGPHGLIAGMTGSGKSEVLQTIILSLAFSYHPNEVGFFLIDYKGGGMASLFEGLPHVLGSISNLSGNMIRRAMISIKSENERRQQKFIEAGVNNITEYLKLYKEKYVKEPIPHIFIIIDEFAELKREEPDFMKELISVARVGRSLGVHLILATQKPTGTVDENILSNSRYRICLKVADKQDSNEMLGKPLAQDIRIPGRGFLQVGNDEIFKEFQCAYTMAPYIQNSVKEKSILFLDSYGKEIFYSNNLLKKSENNELKEVVNRIKKECSIQNTERNNKSVYNDDPIEYQDEIRVRKLWLDPLPKVISYTEYYDSYCKEKKLVSENKSIYDNEIEIFLGLYDDPGRQIQKVFSIDVIENGHIFIQGFIASGKSSFLTLVSYALVKRYDPRKINFYICDFSSLKLLPFRDSAMCGGYFYEENVNELDRLFIMFSEILIERKRKLKGVSYKNYIESVEKLPAMILMIDGMGSFREITGGKYDSEIINILKMGENLGVFIFISALSISSQELPGRMFEHFKTVIAFNLKDKYKYSEALRMSSEKIPEIEDYPGRGVIKAENEAFAFQAFLPAKYDDYEMKNYLITEINVCNRSLSKEEVSSVRRVPAIPEDMSLRQLLKLCIEEKIIDKTKDISNLSFIPVGYEERSGKIYSIPMKNNRAVIISGGMKTGKSNLIKIIKKVSEYLGASVEYKNDFFKEHIVIKHKNEEFSFLVYSEYGDIEEEDKIRKIMSDEYYLIHFGGNLDRVAIADFSYIPYSMQCISKKAGCATVLKTNNQDFAGDVLIVKDSDIDDIS